MLIREGKKIESFPVMIPHEKDIDLNQVSMYGIYVILRDHFPLSSYLKGSGLLIPEKGCAAISSSRRDIRFTIALFPLSPPQKSISTKACPKKTNSIYRQDA